MVLECEEAGQARVVLPDVRGRGQSGSEQGSAGRVIRGLAPGPCLRRSLALLVGSCDVPCLPLWAPETTANATQTVKLMRGRFVCGRRFWIGDNVLHEFAVILSLLCLAGTHFGFNL